MGTISSYTKAKLDDLIGSARARANHTGTQTASTISDFAEAAQGAAQGAVGGSTVVYGTNVEAGNLPDGTLIVELPEGVLL